LIDKLAKNKQRKTEFLLFLENIEVPKEEKVASTTLNYNALSEDELKNKLKEALSEEAYEKAANIRDELSRRKSS
jgi:protein-arginine kinase activator protein McsA